jgi:hypothetical protein
MTALAWDQVGDRVFQTGVDRGVLYLQDGSAVAWNGLTNVTEGSNSELKSSYLNGLKYLEYLAPGDFSGSLKAITYPDELDSLTGIVDAAPGLSYYDQPARSFHLSYRTKLGDAAVGDELGYKIHILYNILATPDDVTFNTTSDSSDVTEFGWSLSALPVIITGHRPTAHISIDSTKASSGHFSAAEDRLYGTVSADPDLPTIAELATIFAS